MKKLTETNRNGHQSITTIVIAAVLLGAAALFAACSTSSGAAKTKATEVIAIDRTGSTGATRTWPQEVGGIVKNETLNAFHDGIDDIVLISIGTDAADTAKIADVPLNNLNCSNDNVCNDDRNTLADQAGSAAGQIANTPVRGHGTDIVAALSTARSICGAARCMIDLVTDAVDKRLSEPGPVQGMVARHAREFPNLTNTTVRIIGIGADGATDAEVLRSTGFWKLALKKAGATDITIARSL